mmetsp:Transcript_8266/g.16752  ORF Transcript_8266/g.16752 Transcript_8266/m.16752 type:complete len:255 (-) Transcript_8266:136-900(-)
MDTLLEGYSRCSSSSSSSSTSEISDSPGNPTERIENQRGEATSTTRPDSFAVFLRLPILVTDESRSAISNLTREILQRVSDAVGPSSCKVPLRPLDSTPHLSISRRGYLRYTQVGFFLKALRSTLRIPRSKTSTVIRARLRLDRLRVLPNDDHSAAYITATVVDVDHDHESPRDIVHMTESVNAVCRRFDMPGYYSTPIFHVSLLRWDGPIDSFPIDVLRFSPAFTSTILIEFDHLLCDVGDRIVTFLLNSSSS